MWPDWKDFCVKVTVLNWLLKTAGWQRGSIVNCQQAIHARCTSHYASQYRSTWMHVCTYLCLFCWNCIALFLQSKNRVERLCKTKLKLLKFLRWHHGRFARQLSTILKAIEQPVNWENVHPLTGWLWFLEVAGCHWLSLAEGGAASKMYWHLPQLLLLFYARYLGDMA